eukprot:TRINITY_DN11648_c0_g1_i1.p1 TRINITY_DN11648_c0_g1~~TRINITY_DN11648_c0_g1_i1.p1  ORF type:complete len:164 (+),score=34.19 TRINITY_DN11648_c0_g1_i1:63-554(+)
MLQRFSVSAVAVSCVGIALTLATSSDEIHAKQNSNFNHTGSSDGSHRIFTPQEKQGCWDNAPKVPNRDPKRWRYDAVGNLVCRKLTSCDGPLCHEYDHIIPFSKGGKSVSFNCQVLQTRVNRMKGNADEITMEKMKSFSHPEKFTDAELDVVERAVYGNISRP